MLSTVPKFLSLDDVQHWALDSLVREGEVSAPRGLATRELLAAGFCLENPRARKIANSSRGWSEALAIGEFAWHVSGATELAPIAYYAPRWREFSEDGEHIRGSCYGSRIFGKPSNGPSQWDRLIELLRSDMATRRAILTVMQSPEDTLSVTSVDVPCVSSCQFLVRGHKLHAIMKMRSNDVIWGLPYDVFLFTMIQEMLACELKLELGSYFHIAGSFHLYERHIGLAKSIVAEGAGQWEAMAPMNTTDELEPFLRFEQDLRTEGSSRVELSAYWSSLAAPLWRHAKRVRDRLSV